mgnify:CR=1 FL=1
MDYPFNNEDMIYNFTTHRYVLTNEYVTNKLGIDLQARVGSNRGINASTIINNLLNNVSMQVYNYLFSHNPKQLLEYVIAKSPSAREIILQAMGAQAVYLFSVGDTTKILDESERKMWLDIMAEQILKNQEVNETGVPLTYVGKNAYWWLVNTLPTYEKGNY